MPPECIQTSDSDLESIISHQDIAKPRRNSTGTKYTCSIAGCNATFKRLDHLDRHEFHHTGIKKHACTYEGCDKIYSIVTHLKRHLRSTHERTAPPEKKVACAVEGCSKMFPSVCNMTRHVREVHENPKIYRCPLCNQQFTQKLKMRRHEITVHTKVYPFRCTKCTKGFYHQWQHERHLVSCKTYPCTNCTQTFEKWSLYLKHCKETQHGRKFYKCEHCSRSYNKPSELHRHVAAKHLEDAESSAYKCTEEGCGRVYAYERNLRQHKLTAHTGKRFDCTETDCGRSFSSAQNLLLHSKREHSEEASARKQTTEIKKKKTKGTRAKRKDAGKPVISNLAILSNLAVDKSLDKALVAREDAAISEALAVLCDDVELEESCTNLNQIATEL